MESLHGWKTRALNVSGSYIEQENPHEPVGQIHSAY